MSIDSNMEVSLQSRLALPDILYQRPRLLISYLQNFVSNRLSREADNFGVNYWKSSPMTRAELLCQAFRVHAGRQALFEAEAGMIQPEKERPPARDECKGGGWQ
jgi:hypothetical protein